MVSTVEETPNAKSTVHHRDDLWHPGFAAFFIGLNSAFRRNGYSFADERLLALLPRCHIHLGWRCIGGGQLFDVSGTSLVLDADV